VKTSSLLAAAVVSAGLASSGDASAGEFQLDIAGSFGASTWRSDYMAGGQLRLGYRFAKVFAIDAVGWEEFASVDKRMNTGLTFGVTGFLPFERIRPSLRLYFIHQHEEGLVSVEESPFGTALGIGAGIRHRAGVGTTLGLEIPFKRTKEVEYVALAGASGTWFPDDTLGPGGYFGLAGGVGLNYSIPGMP
jgi:hypothetical protein